MSVSKIYTESYTSVMFNSVNVEVEGNWVFVSGVPYEYFRKFIWQKYGTAAFPEKFFTKKYMDRVLAVRDFFVPEFIYLIDEAAKRDRSHRKDRYNAVKNELITKTWYARTQVDYPSLVNMDAIKRCIRQPLPHQLEFIKDVYSQKKQKFNLRGYLLAFDQGLGKSSTSIFLKEGLGKQIGVIIAPKSVTLNVWPTEIEETVGKKNIWVIGDDINKLTRSTDYCIVNYEAIEKIHDRIKKLFKGDEILIIVDECHNFKDIHSDRTTKLGDLCDALKCDDILLMSGTPIKALGAECVPILRLLDKFYDKETEEMLLSVTRYRSVINELMHNRLGMLMYRKTKDEILKLPDKIEITFPIKLPNGSDYTLPEVRKKMLDYADQRRKFYHERYDEYVKNFLEILEYYETHCIEPIEAREFRKYYVTVQEIHKAYGKKSVYFDERMKELAHQANLYEQNELIPRLPSDKRKQFREIKTVYKYLELKILGEVLGNLLNDLRTKMTADMIGKDVMKIIRNAEKKTILFSSYTDSLKIAYDKCVKEGFMPMVIDGSNSANAKELVNKFKTSPFINPLIASLKVLSTGHTINEANTVIFLNVPFRSVDYEQASDRCYRIGQDTTVYIYKLVLDTGREPNLSTRMQDILEWSKQEFNAIIDGDTASVNNLMISKLFEQDNFLELISNNLGDFLRKLLP